MENEEIEELILVTLVELERRVEGATGTGRIHAIIRGQLGEQAPEWKRVVGRMRSLVNRGIVTKSGYGSSFNNHLSVTERRKRGLPADPYEKKREDDSRRARVWRGKSDGDINQAVLNALIKLHNQKVESATPDQINQAVADTYEIGLGKDLSRAVWRLEALGFVEVTYPALSDLEYGIQLSSKACDLYADRLIRESA